MKRIALLPFLALLLCQGVFADQVRVTNAVELMRAIAPGRTVVLAPGEYLVSEIPDDVPSDFVRFDQAGDGFQMVVHDVAGLELRGEGTHLSHIIASPRYGQVIRFQDCAGIKLVNIKAGHGPEKGYCTGGVLDFYNCAGITIEDCFLYGSGTEGITAESCAGLTMRNSLITGCTYGIMTIANSSDASFSDCKFFDNMEFEMLNFRNSSKISFTDCKFRKNRMGEFDGIDFMQITECADVSFKRCAFLDNIFNGFCKPGGDFEQKSCTFTNNSWQD
jgi:Right handed beta helix region